ncbi:MAG: leucine-rich repeat protein [Ruminococcus sp.]|nr:leucine-rich repeat protein [Ruminococcus sp.]
MKKHIIKITALIFPLAFLIPMNANAADRYYTADMGDYSAVYYLDENSGAVITEIKSEMTEIVIPSEIDGFKVTGIDKYTFFENTEIKSVTLPESLESIGDYAFSGCLAISDMVIPENVNSIGKGCFMSCTGLENIKINGSIKEIPENCFASCTKLLCADIPFSVTDIGDKAFFGCTSLKDIALHKNITNLSDGCLGAYYDARLNSIAYRDDFTVYAEKNSAAESYASEKSLSFHEIIKGDINGDSIIDSGDASSILAEYSRLSAKSPSKFQPFQRIAADMDDDFLISSTDASEVLKIYARSQTGNK